MHTTTVAVVSGNSPNERFWAEEMRRKGRRFADRISFVWYNELPFEDVLKRAAELPPNSAIYWHLVNVDAAGVVQDNDRALRRLYAVANAPFFLIMIRFLASDRWRPDALASRGKLRDSCRCHCILSGRKQGIKYRPRSASRNSTGGRSALGHHDVSWLERVR